MRLLLNCHQCLLFLLARCYASASRATCPTVCLSVCHTHTPVLCHYLVTYGLSIDQDRWPWM